MLSAASGFDRLSTSSLGHPLEISVAIKFGRDGSNVAYNTHLKAAPSMKSLQDEGRAGKLRYVTTHPK